MAVKRHRFKDILLCTIAILAAVSLLLACASQFFRPARFPILLYFGLYYVPLLLLNILILIIALLRRRLAVLIPVVALIPTLFLADRYVKIGREESPLSGEGVSILTYNVGRYSAGGRKVTPNESVSGIRQFITDEDAGIVCLQEFAVKDTAALSPYLPAYPYTANHLFKGNRSFGNVTLSKYPIVRSEVLTFPDSRNLCLVTDLDVNGHLLRVYNCHLESYSISFATLVKRLFHKDTFTDEVAQVHGRVRGATIRRAEQVESVLASEASSDLPCLVCGDFNDTPVSYTYRKLCQTKKDSFVESGTGFSGTYSALWPMIRVDYILLPQEFASARHETPRVPWSDHYPVTTHIYFHPAPGGGTND